MASTLKVSPGRLTHAKGLGFGDWDLRLEQGAEIVTEVGNSLFPRPRRMCRLYSINSYLARVIVLPWQPLNTWPRLCLCLSVTQGKCSQGYLGIVEGLAIEGFGFIKFYI